jgi:solute carrier family 45, member 1/2/4
MASSLSSSSSSSSSSRAPSPVRHNAKAKPPRGILKPTKPPKSSEQTPLLSTSPREQDAAPRPQRDDDGQAHKSLWYILLLTVSIGGLQIAWSVELSNGSPYLLSLGLSKSLMALVWIAGPLSGTLVQPYVGMLSDNCRISWGRRKPFMLGGAIATSISLMLLGWAKETVGGLLSLFGADPESHGVKTTILVVAILWVYVLDFAINTGMFLVYYTGAPIDSANNFIVQAAIRAFIVDCAPVHQQGKF